MTNRNDRGLRASIPASCRAILRDALAGVRPASAGIGDQDVVQSHIEQHIEQCSFCAARVRAGSKLGAWLAEGLPVAATAVPAELEQTDAMLQCIHERVVESTEAGPVGEWLEQAPVAVPSDAEQPTLADAVASDENRVDLVGSLVRASVRPEASVWTHVRRSILDEVAAEASSSRGSSSRARSRAQNATGWRILLAGAAASAVIGLIALSEGTSSPGLVPSNGGSPTIVFVELDRAPDIEFAVARYGSRR